MKPAPKDPAAPTASAPLQLLLSDDDAGDIDYLAEQLTNRNFDVCYATTPAETLARARQFGQELDLVLLDRMYRDEQGNQQDCGISLFQEVRAILPDVPIYFLTRVASDPKFKQAAFALGAKVCPKAAGEQDRVALLEFLANTLSGRNQRTSMESARIQQVAHLMPGQSAPMRKLHRQIANLDLRPTAGGPPTIVLLRGETGTGKTLAALAIHELYCPKGSPFQQFNAAEVTSSYPVHEIFGRKKGTLGHADEGIIGHFQRGNGGCVFIDEIGRAKDAVQECLYLTLDHGGFMPAGQSKLERFSGIIVLATDSNLSELTKAGRFSAPLLGRLENAKARLDIPPLRERTGDIPYLAQQLLDQFRRTSTQGHLARLSDDALRHLEAMIFPRNVRQLMGVIRTAYEQVCNARPRQTWILPEHLREDPDAALLDLGCHSQGICEQIKTAGGWEPFLRSLRERVHREIVKLGGGELTEAIVREYLDMSDEAVRKWGHRGRAEPTKPGE